MLSVNPKVVMRLLGLSVMGSSRSHTAVPMMLPWPTQSNNWDISAVIFHLRLLAHAFVLRGVTVGPISRMSVNEAS